MFHTYFVNDIYWSYILYISPFEHFYAIAQILMYTILTFVMLVICSISSPIVIYSFGRFAYFMFCISPSMTNIYHYIKYINIIITMLHGVVVTIVLWFSYIPACLLCYLELDTAKRHIGQLWNYNRWHHAWSTSIISYS